MYTLPIEVNQLGTIFSLPIQLSFSKDKKVKSILINGITYFKEQNKVMKIFLADYLEEATLEEANKFLFVSKMILRSFEFSLSSMCSIEDKIYEPTLLNCRV